MNPPRVYHPEPLQVGRDLSLEVAASHHLARVLRLTPGDVITLFNGQGGEYRARIRSADKQVMRVRCEGFEALERESPLRIGLAQALSAGEKMDLTVQKAVELGVAWIQPLTARRSKVRLEGERAERRLAHWQRIVVAACEQCGRNRIPAVYPVCDLTDWLGRFSEQGERFILDPSAECSPASFTRPGDRVTLLVGAEAGFCAEELAAARYCRFRGVRLGPRVLRTETAGIAALATMQALWGDLSASLGAR
jgi:16S rRNA (uracil1498-N3)-methyltransferase